MSIVRLFFDGDGATQKRFAVDGLVAFGESVTFEVEGFENLSEPSIKLAFWLPETGKCVWAATQTLAKKGKEDEDEPTVYQTGSVSIDTEPLYKYFDENQLPFVPATLTAIIGSSDMGFAATRIYRGSNWQDIIPTKMETPQWYQDLLNVSNEIKTAGNTAVSALTQVGEQALQDINITKHEVDLDAESVETNTGLVRDAKDTIVKLEHNVSIMHGEVLDTYIKFKDASSRVYRYCGSVATVDALPTTATEGDVYNVETNGTNYAWTGTEWDALGATFDLSPYAKKQEVIDETSRASGVENLLNQRISGEIANRQNADAALKAELSTALMELEDTKADALTRNATVNNVGTLNPNDKNSMATADQMNGLSYQKATLGAMGFSGTAVKISSFTTFRRGMNTDNGGTNMWLRILRHDGTQWYVAYQATTYVTHNSYTENGQRITHTMAHKAGTRFIPTDEQVVFCYATSENAPAGSFIGFGMKVVPASPNMLASGQSSLPNVNATPSWAHGLAFDAVYEEKQALSDALDDKQDKLTAGENITIENGVISATGGSATPTMETATWSGTICSIAWSPNPITVDFSGQNATTANVQFPTAQWPEGATRMIFFKTGGITNAYGDPLSEVCFDVVDGCLSVEFIGYEYLEVDAVHHASAYRFGNVLYISIVARRYI